MHNAGVDAVSTGLCVCAVCSMGRLTGLLSFSNANYIFCPLHGGGGSTELRVCMCMYVVLCRVVRLSLRCRSVPVAFRARVQSRDLGLV